MSISKLPTLTANWRGLRDTRQTEITEGLQAGGESRRTVVRVQAEGLTASQEDDRLTLRGSEREASLTLAPEAAGLPESWRGYGQCRLSLSPPCPDLEVTLEILSARGALRGRVGEGGVAEMDLVDLPLICSNLPSWSPQNLRITVQAPEANFEIRGIHLELIPNPDGKPVPVLDAFGQRRSRTWPGKAASFEELRERRAAEATAFAADPVAQRGRFGGFLERPASEASGYFRLGDVNGRHMFVDPEGKPFWSLGPTGIRLSDYTRHADREDLFESLPDPNGPYAAAYQRRPLIPTGPKDQISFYRWNVLRTYGDVERWREHTLNRFRHWGVNTCGNWSSDMLEQTRIPHTRWLLSRVPGAPCLYDGRFPDVFSPAWKSAFREHAREQCEAVREHPWILGWFVDNELPWGRIPPAEQGPYAERYFAEIAEVLRDVVPNHLYLGCRFVSNRPEDDVVRAAGRHCDVLTVNCYKLRPERERFEPWVELGGKPILIGEHHLPLESPRQVSPPYPAFSQDERRAGYLGYLQHWAEQPWSLGAHWFQYVDQPGTGRFDGENQTVGYVDITDEPHAELIDVLRTVSQVLPEWLD